MRKEGGSTYTLISTLLLTLVSRADRLGLAADVRDGRAAHATHAMRVKREGFLQSHVR
jgi:hypothetical protein